MWTKNYGAALKKHIEASKIGGNNVELEVCPVCQGEPYGMNMQKKKEMAVLQASDCLVLDYHWDTQDENGVSFAEKLRRKGFNKPIIIFTSESENALREQNPQWDDLNLLYAAKPISPNRGDVAPLCQIIADAFKTPSKEIKRAI